MSHKNILRTDDTLLLVVDFQEAFRSSITDFSVIGSRIATAVTGCGLLGVPVFVTEQYPKGLGPTAEEVSMSLSDDTPIFEKTRFSAFGAEGLADRLTELGKTNILLCGLETHICINQTAHDLLENAYTVYLLTDCIGSRFDTDRQTGIAKMARSGVVTSTVEMMLFEMMLDAKHPHFKEIQQLIK